MSAEWRCARSAYGGHGVRHHEMKRQDASNNHVNERCVEAENGGILSTAQTAPRVPEICSILWPSIQSRYVGGHWDGTAERTLWRSECDEDVANNCRMTNSNALEGPANLYCELVQFDAKTTLQREVYVVRIPWRPVVERGQRDEIENQR